MLLLQEYCWGRWSLTATTQVAFKNCALFKDCRTEIDGTFVNEANFINIAMPMYHLIEYT